MRTLFISDLHLEDSQPLRTEWLLTFLAGPARKSTAVYILGDLFEYWIGDDAPSATAQHVAKATAELHESGVKCYFLHGNRDFLLGEKYAASAKLKLLPETVVVDLYGIPTLLLHGDTLCTDDTEYQALRQQLRDPAWQAGVLAMTIEQRLQMAQEARAASMQHTGSAAEEIMDVNAAAVASAFREQGVSRMIHGHTHRPAFHQVDLDATSAERIVLADWYDSGSYLEVSTDGARSLNVQ
jgi:UDP-2,3-diacylglucosamine hydrolase